MSPQRYGKATKSPMGWNSFIPVMRAAIKGNTHALYDDLRSDGNGPQHKPVVRLNRQSYGILPNVFRYAKPGPELDGSLG